MWRDIRFAVRTLGRTPLFTAVAVLSMALGIGANAAIFSLLDQVVLRSLPVPQPERLVLFRVSDRFPGTSTADNLESVLSYPLYRHLKNGSQGFAGVIARSSTAVNVSQGGTTERASAELVSGNLFQVLGVTPVLGRTLLPSDEGAPGANPVVVLGAGYWATRFGANRDIVGKTLVVNGRPMEVVGVAPAPFRGMVVGNNPDLFIPLSMKQALTASAFDLEDRQIAWLSVFGRLKDGISVDTARASARTAFASGLEDLVRQVGRPRDSWFTKHVRSLRLDLVPAAQGVNELRRQFESAVLALMGMVGLVLLIVCANVAGLVTARAAGRQREVAVRAAMGAGRLALIRQFVSESLVLSLAGGIVGLVVAGWTVDGLLRAMGPETAGALSSDLDPRVVAFTLTVSVLTGLVFGLAPGLQAIRPRVVDSLRARVDGVSTGAGHSRIRRGLVVAQVALSLSLLVMAGLFGRSVSNLMHLDPGFRPEGVLTFAVDPTLQGYPAERVNELYRQIQVRLRAQPGVEGVAAANAGPLGNRDRSGNVTVEGYRGKDEDDGDVTFVDVSSDYFRTLGVPVVAGREFDDRDMAGRQKLVVVNEAFARKYASGSTIVGRRMAQGGGDRVVPDHEIVGVVRDLRQANLRDRSRPTAYVPFTLAEGADDLTFFVRARQAESTLGATVRRLVRDLDANTPVFEMKPMSQLIAESATSERVIALLAAAFGTLATVVAAVGLYGVMAFMVLRRTSELGVRIALGAAPRAVAGIVMREVSWLLAVGVALGLPLALLASRSVESQLFGVGAFDPGVLAVALLLLSGVGLLAGAVPARRAAAIDPIRAIRQE